MLATATPDRSRRRSGTAADLDDLRERNKPNVRWCNAGRICAESNAA
jgi:hypothetical protein